MQVMTEKGLLTRAERFRSHVYEARATKEQTQSSIMSDLIQRAFEGSAKNLVLGALASQPSSPEDLEEIRRMLETFTAPKGRKLK
jgi:predicted transcriptional regulator